MRYMLEFRDSLKKYTDDHINRQPRETRILKNGASRITFT